MTSMNILSKKSLRAIRKTAFAGLTILMVSCTEQIDESSRYVYTDYTASNYLSRHEQYSEYHDLMSKVKVSSLSATSVQQLLSARGNYTVFAPTNDAIHDYLDSLVSQQLIASPSWDAFQDSVTLDSIRKVIVLNSIVDGKDLYSQRYFVSDFPVTQDAELPLANMMNRKLQVHYGETVDDITIAGCEIDTRNRDIRVSNGIVHAVNAVIAPSDNSLGDLLENILKINEEGYHVMAMLTKACGLMDTLRKVEDEEYRYLYLTGMIDDFTSTNGYYMDNDSYAPEHRYYGYTLFAEPDELWSQLMGKPALEITVEDVMDYLKDNDIYPDAVRDNNYKDEGNLLNQFVTYHYLPARLTPDHLIYHYNEKGYIYRTGELGVAMSEFYVTMGKRRLLQIFESKESGGVHLNRFPVLDNGRHGTYHELYCEPAKEGYLVGETNRTGKYNVTNAMLYPIDKLLVYDQETRNNLSKGRIRFDFCAIWPEMTNNDIRCSYVLDDRHQCVCLPNDAVYRYLDDVWMDDDTYFYEAMGYLSDGYHNYQGDEMRIHGQLDMICRLPPVPTQGTYECRYSVTNGSTLRSIVQFYWGDNMNNLTPMDIPMDLRKGGLEWRTKYSVTDSGMGWVNDTDDDDYNAEVDKKLRNNGYMKGANLYSAGTCGNATMAREDEYSTRRILFKQTMDPDKTYYIRFKQVTEDASLQFYMDYMELVPKEVYDNPAEPEDIW